MRFGGGRGAAISLAGVALLLLQGAGLSAWAQSGAAGRKSTPNCNRAAFRIVLDVGHTAESPGAMSARGVMEYDYNLRLAQRIERHLRDAGFAQTTRLVTAGTGFVGLVARVTRANSAPADLLLSIHHDSVPDHFIEEWDYVGSQQAFSDRFRGHSIFVSAENGQHRRSLVFGKLLGAELKARGLRYAAHYTEAFMGNKRRQLLDADAGVYRYDQLYVLRATRMPAVLLEAGSIIHRDEEMLMRSPEHQALIGEAVVAAVERYCAAFAPRSAEQAQRRPDGKGTSPRLTGAAQARSAGTGGKPQ